MSEQGALVAVGHLHRPGNADHVPLILSYSEMCEVLVYDSWEAEDPTKVGRCQPAADALQLDAQGSPDHLTRLIPASLEHWHVTVKWQNPPNTPCSSAALSCEAFDSSKIASCVCDLKIKCRDAELNVKMQNALGLVSKNMTEPCLSSEEKLTNLKRTVFLKSAFCEIPVNNCIL